MLNDIFKAAIKHNIITQNPMELIPTVNYNKKHGSALSNEEEHKLLFNLKEENYKKAIAILLYTGLRPNELETIKIKKNFIIAKNSKRKNKKIEFKKIPIIKALEPYLQNLPNKFPTIKLIRRRFNAILPEHHLYDLRTTFYTRCKEYGVEEPALNEFVGHSAGILADTYTDLSDEYLLIQSKKLCKWN